MFNTALYEEVLQGLVQCLVLEVGTKLKDSEEKKNLGSVWSRQFQLSPLIWLWNGSYLMLS